MQNPSFVYWFAYFDETEPSVRYRALYSLKALRKEAGIPYALFLPRKSFSNYLRFVFLFLSALFRKRTAVLVIQKVHTSGFYAQALKLLVWLRPSRTFYDTDDADYLRFPPHTIHWFMRHCGLVIAGSEAILQYAIQQKGRGVLITSPVIPHPFLKRTREDVFTVGWIGYYSAHRESLKQLLFPAVAALRFPVSLMLLGISSDKEEEEIRRFFTACPHVQLQLPRNINWLQEEGIYQQLAQCDVGVSPLLDTGMNRAKSAFKLKQFLCCGVPVLASSVGENKRFLQQGYNGFFCDTPGEYAEMLARMAELEASDYGTLSNNALESANRFSLESNTQMLLCLFRRDCLL